MPSAVIVAADYGKVGGWLSDLPVADVSLRSIYPVRTGEYRGQAVIDSGSDISWVPRGFPRKYGWPENYQVGPRPVHTLSGEGQAAQYVLVIRISAVEWRLPVCEMPARGFQCPVIGQDVLEDIIVLLEGPTKRLTITK